MIRPLSIVAVFVATASLLSQTPPVAPVPPRDRIGEQSKEMRNQIETGRQVKSHVRVSVRLKNGNKLRGVVKDGRLVERVDGLRFVDAQAQEAGAGIRLWYSNGGRNYVFVPFADLSEYQVLQRMSQKQLEEFEQEMQKVEERRAEKLRADEGQAAAAARTAAEAASADPGGEVPPAPAQESAPVAPPPPTKSDKQAKVDAEGAAVDKIAGTEAEQAQQKEWFALLQAYPPTAGWNQAKRDEIARRKVVIGALPSEKEKHFVDKFAEWQKACAFFLTKAEAKVGEDGTAGTVPPTGATDSAESADTSKKSRRKAKSTEAPTTGTSGQTGETSTGKKSRTKKT